MRRLLVALPLIAALAACGKHDHEHGDDGGGHAHEAPHGGTLIELGDHAAHIEVTIDHDAGTATLWVYDGAVKESKADAPPVLRFKSDGKPVSVEATGTGHEWTFRHEALKGEPEGARFQVVVNGKTYTPDWHHAH